MHFSERCCAGADTDNVVISGIIGNIINTLFIFVCFFLSLLDEIPKTLAEYSYARRKCYDVVSHYKFDLVIAVVIGLNVVFMAIEHDKMSVVSFSEGNQVLTS